MHRTRRLRINRVRRARLVLLSLALTSTTLAAQIRAPDVLTGRVLADSGRTRVGGATVIVTRAPDRAVQQTTADVNGTWRMTFDPGTGDYLVYISAEGYTAVRRRVARDAPPPAGVTITDSLLRVVVTLRKVAVQTLATIDVVAAKPKPARPGGDALKRGVGAAEQDLDGVNGRVAPDFEGNLAALAATTPGLISLSSGGISALGLGESQSAATLNGLQFSGQDLPRDLRTVGRAVTSTYDPSRGWFGGAQIALELSPGLPYVWSSAHVTIDAPALQMRSTAGSPATAPVTNVQGSVGREGGLAQDRLTYSVGIQASRRAADAVSLATASPDALRQAGVSPDSLAALRTVLGALGIPQSAAPFGSAWGARTEDRLSFAGRIGTAVIDYATNTEPKTIRALSSFGSWRRADGVGLSPLALDTRAGESRALTLGVQGQLSTFLGASQWLLDLKTGLSGTDERQTAYTLLPGATLRIAGDAADEFAPALSSLAIGGAGALSSARKTGLWESQGTLAFFVPGHQRHEWRLAADIRFDASDITPGTDRSGTYQFENLSALANSNASRFTRTLQSPAMTAAVWNGFVSLGDEWHVKPGLRVLMGARLEGNRFASAPALNTTLANALGVETDRTPNDIAISPRLGFTWRRSVRQDGYTIGKFGTFRIPSMTVVRGGVGQFRAFVSPEVVGLARVNTGLSDGARQLICTGAAVPAPDWSTWVGSGAFPTTCANGAPPALVDGSPSVTALAPSFTAPSSWRANLAISSVRWKTAYSIEGIVSLNQQQAGVRDMNFAGRSMFTLDQERRPVYVPAALIVPATGLVSPVTSRSDPAFSRVLLQHSDLRSVSRQVAFTLSPSQFPSRWWTSGTYVLASMQQRSSGFDGATAGDPRALSWARGDVDVRHQFLVQAGVTAKAVSLTLLARLASGMPFTPLVNGDINGDGFANDAAFIFDPTAVSTPASVRTGLQTLLANAQPHTRRCIEAAVGRIAGRNECTGPWTANMNARLAIGGTAIGLGSRAQIGVNFSNPLGGLDQLLHGDALRGWGSPFAPDRTLLIPRSFDLNTRTFEYAVNPRFGDTRPRAGAITVPFRVTIDVSMDLAPTLGYQQMQKWLSPGRQRPGTKLLPKDYLDRFMRGTPDLYRSVLAQSDSLLLSRSQIEQLQSAQTSARGAVQALWEPLATELAASDRTISAKAAEQRQHAVGDRVWDFLGADVRKVLPNILNTTQIALLPRTVAEFYRTTNNRKASYFFF